MFSGECCYVTFSYSNVGSPSEPPSMNISLEGLATFYFEHNGQEIYYCSNFFEVHWEVLKDDGKTELYTVVNERHLSNTEEYTDSGLEIIGHCSSNCYSYLWISPTDLRYDGAKITATLSLSMCSDSPYTSDAMALHIQG